MRHLDFSSAPAPFESSKELYEVIYDAITNCPRGFDKSEARVFGRVLTKLESIGASVERDGRASFSISDGLRRVPLEDAEFKLMLETLDSIKWAARFTRKVTALYEWLDKAPAEEPKADGGA